MLDDLVKSTLMMEGGYKVLTQSFVSMLAVVHIPGLELDIHGEEAGTFADMLEQEGFCETFHEYKEK
ncbi:hypothetical protein K040078D81_35200 [Blautia hominis]|uniref:Uncharacterized protein n=2 Tax=Blautia hominis TaxID=2025493 RepID=A0ABQ0BDJ3_9FIRM